MGGDAASWALRHLPLGQLPEDVEEEREEEEVAVAEVYQEKRAKTEKSEPDVEREP